MLKQVINKEERKMRFDLQFFAEGGDNAAATAGTDAGAADTGAAKAEPKTQGNETPLSKEQEAVLSSEEIKRLIQSTVDTKTAELGKTIATLKKENETLKRANMTAEEIKKADKEEFERQKAEVELQKRQLHAHRIVASAGYGDNADAVVDMVLGESDEATSERLNNFKALVDKIVAETVKKTFKENGRTPNGGNSNSGEAKNENTFAAELGKKKADMAKQANAVLNHYYGGKN